MSNAPAAIACVIPTHGRPECLLASLTSALAQVSCPELTVVVVDDLHDPQVERIVLQVAALHPHIAIAYIPRREGQPGASASRNAGANATQSEWLAFLDDDDLWEPSHIESLYSALTKEPSADLAVAWMKLITPSGSVWDHYSIAAGLRSTQVVAINPGITGSNFIIRREVFERLGGFDEELPVSNDKDFFYRFLSRGSRYVVSRHRTVSHRKHGSGQLTNWDERRAEGLEAYIRKHDSVLSTADRRHLESQIDSIRMRVAASLNSRIVHAVRFMTRASPRALWGAATARLLGRPAR